MTNAEIYLRAAELIDSGGASSLLEAFDRAVPRYRYAYTFEMIDVFSVRNKWTRETRVLALCLMAAMEQTK